ncbi:MAG: hypothetical protein RL249_479, partial [Actinomycetota bacterium]
MRIHLGGSSRQSLVAARGKLDAAVKGATAASASELSSQLFFAADVLSKNTSIRRAFSDTSRDAASKGALVKDLFAKSLAAPALEILTDVSTLRWSAAGDLVHVLEQLAIEAEASAANINNELDRVEDELFETSQLIIDNFELRKALVGTGTPEAKSALITEVLSKKASASTVRLAVALVSSLRGRSIEAAFADYLYGLANRRNRLIAVIRVASAISDAQKSRLAAAIEKQVGQPIRVNIEVEPSILGGVSGKLMAELKIQPNEIRDALANFVKSYDPGTAARDEVGTVSQAGDGIARVEGLPSTMANELLQFENGTLGLALNLDVREIGVVILGDYAGIEEGSSVRRTGEVLSVPVGDGFLGRVVDPLGRPIDGKGEIKPDARRALELQAPTVVQRQPVKEPLATGIKAIDAMTAIGRGQRQLIIGDRQTGKTAVAIDTIINQRENWLSGDPKKQVKCIYVAIGQKGSTIASVKGALEEAGAMEYTTIVASPASDPAGFKYLAPYTGSAIGQHWMYNGQHVLIVFDDLSKQAEAYRSVSLLLRRPPGREAYPGDVFYLHSRLLERCAKLSDDLGGGSMTGLPIIETKGNDVSAFIPTNVISITDGQCFLETDLFNAGVRPA